MAAEFDLLVYRADQTRHDTYKAYSDIGSEYENVVVRDMEYRAPKKTADAIPEFFKDNKDVKILDIACGTGCVAEYLWEYGFKNIDGVDPAPGMLEVAKPKNLYQKLICAPLGYDPLPFEENAYDAITVCGAMGYNMIPCEGIYEMIRLVKPGGYIVNVFRSEVFTKTPEYVGRLEPLMDELEKKGKWRQVRREPFPEYQNDKEGVVLVHQVC